MSIVDKLQLLYADGGKHDNYQNVPEFVRRELGFSVLLNEQWRGDTARYNFLLKTLEVKSGEVVSDIGANTGFFTLSLAHEMPKVKFNAYEMNDKHVKFIKEIAQYFKLENVNAQVLSVDLQNIHAMMSSDLLINFNVLHHAGVDFDKGLVSSQTAFIDYAVQYLKTLRKSTRKMIFQMGYNWGGDKKKPLVALKDDLIKISFTVKMFENSGWETENIALCHKVGYNLSYQYVPKHIWNYLISDSDLRRERQFGEYLESIDLNNLSEFYRRPIFYLRRKKL